MLSFSLYQSFWPLYLLEQGLNVELVALLSVIGMSSRLLAQLPGGILADRLGRKKALLIASPLFVIQPLIYMFATSWEHFVIGQIFGHLCLLQPRHTMQLYWNHFPQVKEA